MIQCHKPAAAIAVSYKPSVQQVQTSKRKHIFHYTCRPTLIDYLIEYLKSLFQGLINFTSLMPAGRKLLASLVIYPQKETFFQ